MKKMRNRSLGKMGLDCGEKMGFRCSEEVKERERKREREREFSQNFRPFFCFCFCFFF